MIKRRNIAESHRDTFVITYRVASSVADAIFGIVPVKSELVSVKEVHGTAGSDGSAVSGVIERLQGTETSTNGDDVATGINFKGTADTVQTATIVTASNVNIFAAGDRVGLDVTGTTTALANVIIACEFRPVD